MSTLAEKVHQFIVRTLDSHPTVKYVSSKYDTKNSRITYYYQITNRNNDFFTGMMPTMSGLNYDNPNEIYLEAKYIIGTRLNTKFPKRIFYSENKYISIKFIKSEFTNGLLQIFLTYQILPSETLFDLLPEDMIYEILKVLPEDSLFTFSSIEIEKVYHRYILNLWKGYLQNFKNLRNDPRLVYSYKHGKNFLISNYYTNNQFMILDDRTWDKSQIFSDEDGMKIPTYKDFKTIYYIYIIAPPHNYYTVDTKVIGTFSNGYYFYMQRIADSGKTYISKNWKYIWNQLTEPEKYDFFKVQGYPMDIIYQIISDKNIL